MIDKDLKQHVENALDWEPSEDSKDIGVAVDQSVITLRGNAVRAAWAAPGVHQGDDRITVVP